MKPIKIKVPPKKPWIRVPRNTGTIVMKHRGTKRSKQKIQREIQSELHSY